MHHRRAGGKAGGGGARRFHLPVGGTIRSIRHVAGKLYTVNPIAVASTYANVFTQACCHTAPCCYRTIRG